MYAYFVHSIIIYKIEYECYNYVWSKYIYEMAIYMLNKYS